MSLSKFLALLLLALTALEAPASEKAGNEGKLVFEMTDKSVIPSIAISNEDGTDLRMLAKRGGNPKWFPSGDKVAYYLTKEIGNGNSPAPYLEGKTLIVDLNGNLIREIPYWVSDIHPDGNRLLVQKILHYENFGKATTYELGVYDLQTDRYMAIFSPDQMPKNLYFVTPTSAKWFPDGKNVMFQFLGDYRHSLDASYLSELSPSVAEHGVIPDSQDVPYWGKLSLADGKFHLLKIPGISVIAFGGFDISPDSTKVVFTGTPKDHYERPAIYIFNLESRSVSLLHREEGVWSCWNPVWSNDGRRILFNFHMPDDLGSETSLKIMDEDGTNVRRVFKTGIVHGLWNAIGGTVPERKENADWWQP